MSRQKAFDDYKKLIEEEKRLVVAGFSMQECDPMKADILHRLNEIWADKKKLSDEIWPLKNW